MYHLPYSRLIMEIERGPRVLINDMDPGKRGDRAIGVNLLRDCGLGSVYWDDYEDMGY